MLHSWALNKASYLLLVQVAKISTTASRSSCKFKKKNTKKQEHKEVWKNTSSSKVQHSLFIWLGKVFERSLRPRGQSWSQINKGFQNYNKVKLQLPSINLNLQHRSWVWPLKSRPGNDLGWSGPGSNVFKRPKVNMLGLSWAWARSWLDLEDSGS